MADIKYLIQVDAQGAVTSIENFEGTLDTIGKTSEVAGSKFAGMFKQVTLGLGAWDLTKKGAQAVKDVIISSIKEAATYEKAWATLNATFTASGRNMPGMTQSLKAYAQEIEHLGMADEAAALQSEALLMRMTNLNEKGIKEAVRWAVGLSQVYGMDLNNATELVGRGMEGVYRGFTTLAPQVVTATTDAEKHARMMKFLNETYVTATAQMETYSGQLKKRELEWGEIKKRLGETILNTGILQAVEKEMAAIIRDSTEALKSHKGEVEKQVEVENKRYEVLKKVADGMGWSSVGLANLIMQHQGLNTKLGQGTKALYDWIKYNSEGTREQKLLAAAEEEQNKKLADQKKGFNETGDAGGKLAQTYEEMKKALEDLAKETGVSHPAIAKLQKAFDAAQKSGKFLASELEPIAERLSKLKDQAIFGIRPLEDLTASLKDFAAEADKLKPAEAPGLANLKAYFENLPDTVDPAMADIQEAFTRTDVTVQRFYEHLKFLADQAAKKIKDSVGKSAWEMAKTWQEKLQVIAEVTNLFISQTDAVFSQANTNRLVQIDNEYNARKKAILAMQIDEVQKNAMLENLDKEFEVKRRDTMRSYAGAQKAVALANAVVNTAEAVSKAYSAAPPPFSIILGAIAAALGAVQIGLIAKQPLPLAAGAIFKKPAMLTSQSGQRYEVAETGEAELVSSPKKLREAIFGSDRGYQTERPIIIQVHVLLDSREMKNFTIKTVREGGQHGFLGPVGKAMS